MCETEKRGISTAPKGRKKKIKNEKVHELVYGNFVVSFVSLIYVNHSVFVLEYGYVICNTIFFHVFESLYSRTCHTLKC